MPHPRHFARRLRSLRATTLLTLWPRGPVRLLLVGAMTKPCAMHGTHARSGFSPKTRRLVPPAVGLVSRVVRTRKLNDAPKADVARRNRPIAALADAPKQPFNRVKADARRRLPHVPLKTNPRHAFSSFLSSFRN